MILGGRMILKILQNSFVRKAVLKNIKLSKNKAFYIWSFASDTKKYTGFTPVAAYYGGKLHRWYSLLIGYYLPEAYTINFDNIIEKECIIVLGQKGVAREIIPTQEQKKAIKQDTNYHQNPGSTNNMNEGPDESLFT